MKVELIDDSQKELINFLDKKTISLTGMRMWQKREEEQKAYISLT